MLRSYWFAAGIRLRALAATWMICGFSKELFVRLLVLPLVGWLIEIFFWLDNVFYPGISRVKVDRPIFIVGHPRSGTTFLHRLLTAGGDFVVFRAWEIMMPPLTGRRMFRGVFDLARRQRRQGIFFPKEVGHEATLDSVEEEELLFLHTANTQFMALLTPLAFSDWDFTPLVFCDRQPEAVQRYAAEFLRRCYQRQIYALGKSRVLSKLNYSGMRLRSLMKVFPDAKIIYIVRSPAETIPSHLSLHRSMFSHQWGLDRIPQSRLKRYFRRRYQHNLDFYRHMEDLFQEQVIPPSQLYLLTYDTLRQSPVEVARELEQFAEIALSPESWERIRPQDERQKSFQREHEIQSLEEFGLTSENIVADFGFIFEKYGFSREPAKVPATA